jgi:Skp family chaperone for outer membrane proteins
MANRHLSNIVVALPLAAALVWAGGQALALRTAVAANTAALVAPPTAVAVVDVAKVLDSIKANARWNVQIDQLRASAQAEQAARNDDIKRMQETLKNTTDPTQRTALIDELALKQLRAEEWGKLKLMEIDRERSLMWQAMYRSVRAEAANVAKSEGYQLVLVDDSATELRTMDQQNMSRETQIQQQIGMLRVLHVDRPAVDITEKVIVRINNLQQ